jgi:hypothetical protein
MFCWRCAAREIPQYDCVSFAAAGVFQNVLNVIKPSTRDRKPKFCGCGDRVFVFPEQVGNLERSRCSSVRVYEEHVNCHCFRPSRGGESVVA